MGKKQAKKQQQPLTSLSAAEPHGFPAPILACFDEPAADHFAIVTQAMDRHRLRIIDTATGTTRAQFESEKDQNFTCLSWTVIQETSQSKSPAKKKKKKQSGTVQPPSTATKVVALGLENGSILLYSFAHGSVIRTLSGGHTQAVSQVVFTEDATRAYSVAADLYIVEWDMEDGSVVARWKADDKSVRKLQLCHGEKRIASAGHTIKIWDLETKEEVKKYTGHATLITSLLFSEDDEFCVTSAEQDRFVNIWSTKEASGNISALTMDSNATHLALTATSGGDNDLLAIAEDGSLNIWRNTSAPVVKGKKKSATRQPDSVIRIRSSHEDTETQPIFLASFVDDGKIMIARGNTIKPAFEKIVYVNEKGKLEAEMVLVRTPVTGLLMDETYSVANNLKATTKQYDESRTTVLGTTDFGLPSAGIIPDTVPEPTLEEKLKEMEVEEEKQISSTTSTVKPGSVAVPKANSLTTALSQALHSGDSQLLEACLTHTNPEVIRATIQRFPPRQIVPLLREVVTKFQRRPNRGLALLEWVKACLLIHAGYLMTVPELVRELSGFYQSVDARLGVYRRLVRLSGRLEMVNGQISSRQSRMAGKVDVTNEKPVTVYVEGEEDEEADSDEDMLDLAEDADMLLDEDDVALDTDEEEEESELSGDDGEDDDEEDEEELDSDDE